jgi:hypothetical protein
MPKISELPTGEPLDGQELLPIVQNGDTYSINVNAINRLPTIQLDLSGDGVNININQLGCYYITNASEEYTISLPNPADCNGFELIFANYDQNLDALFGGDYIPYIQSSTQSTEKYLKIPKKETVKLICVNGVWNACAYATSNGAGPTEDYLVYSALITYDSMDEIFDQSVFKDTIGDISFSYVQAGQYRIESAGGLFTPNKTQIFIGQNNNNGWGGEGNFVFYTCNQQSASILVLTVYDVNVGGSDVSNSDLMLRLPIEIKVYP